MLGSEEEWVADLVDLIYGARNHHVLAMECKRRPLSSGPPHESSKKCLGPAPRNVSHTHVCMIQEFIEYANYDIY